MMLDSRTPHGVGTSAFSQLDAPPERIFVQEAGRVKLLPTCCGTYAFHDGAGELLYIGKAKNVRARVLSHFRESVPHPLLLRRWTHLVRQIEVRPAESEMEALLVEADLVGRLRPPFNRQMRSWSRYCYLLPTDDHANPLSISCQLQSWRRCFGPYRTRRQAVGTVEAVFRLVARNGDADILHHRSQPIDPVLHILFGRYGRALGLIRDTHVLIGEIEFSGGLSKSSVHFGRHRGIGRFGYAGHDIHPGVLADRS